MLTLEQSPAEAARPTPRRETMLERCISGGLAGLIATAPMTWTMRAASHWLPWRASRRLPPRQITEATLETVYAMPFEVLVSRHGQFLAQVRTTEPLARCH